MDNIYLSVVIPAYNEAKRIPETLKKVTAYLKSQSYSWEVVVVNDGSKDDTAQVVREAISQNENIRLIDNKENNGKGYVVRQGLLEAKGEIRVFMDADNSTSIDHIERMFSQFKNGYDFVIGSRDMKDSKLAIPQSWFRQRLGDVFNLLVQFVCGLWGVWDTQCGFKAITKKCVDDVVSQCKINRFAFDPEMLIVARRMGYKIKEVPVTWFNDAASTVKLKNMIKMGIDLLKIRLNIIKGLYAKK